MSGLITFDNTAQAADAMKADLLCKSIGATLRKHYPNRSWYVDVSISGGVAKILCPQISMRHGYSVHIHNKTNDQIEKAVVMAGGQILEMFKLSRERTALGGEESLLRDSRGEALSAATGL
ncbi:MAG: hypothetical protein Q8L60_10695 [Gammaproteobacteria bacterium]|nr:hypothetical protein [Gammaproteobacteria bacterium]MDP2346816.1 hypothetical protein [Gammaproteobacteria bacterium]